MDRQHLVYGCLSARCDIILIFPEGEYSIFATRSQRIFFLPRVSFSPEALRGGNKKQGVKIENPLADRVANNTFCYEREEMRSEDNGPDNAIKNITILIFKLFLFHLTKKIKK